MVYIFDIVEGSYYGQMRVDNVEKMIEVGTWLNQRCEDTGLRAGIRSSDYSSMGFLDEITEQEKLNSEFSDFLLKQFEEFRSRLN